MLKTFCIYKTKDSNKISDMCKFGFFPPSLKFTYLINNLRWVQNQMIDSIYNLRLILKENYFWSGLVETRVEMKKIKK